MATFDWRSRARAALIHLGGSALVAALAAALVFLLWFPSPYTLMAGGTGLFILITSVDVALGPLITFAVFNPAKGWTHLRRDLVIVVLLQTSALVYGLHTMYVARPAVMALEGNRLRVVTANDVLVEELPQALPGFTSLSITGPKLVNTADVPPAEKLRSIEWALSGYDVGTRPKYWRPWDDAARREALAGSKPIAELAARFPARKAELDAVLASTGRPREQLRFLPIISAHADAVALIDGTRGDIVGYAAFNPY